MGTNSWQKLFKLLGGSACMEKRSKGRETADKKVQKRRMDEKSGTFSWEKREI